MPDPLQYLHRQKAMVLLVLPSIQLNFLMIGIIIQKQILNELQLVSLLYFNFIFFLMIF